MIRAMLVSILICVAFSQNALSDNRKMMGETSQGLTINYQACQRGVELSVELESLQIAKEDGGENVTVEIPNLSYWNIPEKPTLPRWVQWVVIPPSGEVSIRWEGNSEKRHLASQSVMLFHNPDLENVKDQNLNLSPSSTKFPSQPVLLGEPAVFGGVRIAPLAINPVQWDRQENDLIIWHQLRVHIMFEGEVNQSYNHSRIPSSVRRILAPLVINDEILGGGDEETLGACVYVIPNYQGVREAIDPLVRWRREQGYPTEVIVVPANASNVDVKRALQAAYDNWDIPPEFITLVGEADLQNADFMIPTWDVGRAYMWETDYKYVLLNGPDLLPEAAIGRISCRSVEELRTLVRRILTYETQPYRENTDWYLRAAVMANDPRTGYSSYYLQQWARRLMLESGYTEVDTFYFMHNNPVTGQVFIRNNVNRGIALFNYRGWGQFGGDWAVGDAARYLRNGDMMPLWLIPTCNSGDFADHVLSPYAYTEDLFWASGGGCIGAIGSSGFTHTNYNNVLDGAILNALYRDSTLQIGWALNRGKIELYRQFGLFNDVQDPQVQNLLIWEAHAYQFNLIGDAATAFWMGIPREMEVEHEPVISYHQNRLTIRVRNSENDLPLENMWVTLVHGDRILRKGKSNRQGSITFTFSPGELPADTLRLTVYGNNFVPYRGVVAVNEPTRYVGYRSFIVDDDNAGRSRGNGDRLPNPGETIELRVFLGNLGDSAVSGPLNAELTFGEGDIDMIVSQVRLNQAPPPADSVLVTFIFRVGTGNQNNSRLVGNLSISSGEENWLSTITLFTAAPKLDYVRHSFSPPQFNPADTVGIDVVFRNIGRQNSPRLRAHLISRSPTLIVHQGEGEVAPIALESPDSLASTQFRIYAHHLTIPGSTAELTVALEADNGFRDTVNFTISIGEPRQNAPLGPDPYGYVAFDDTDDNWEVAPRYEWVEIDPSLGGRGTDTGIRDLGNEQDFAVLVDLPFPFRYYGEMSQRVTICSNGWFSFKDERRNADFQNRRIPPAFGPRAQVCVFWDDLINYTDRNRNPIGGVFTWFDEENHRFIIEWSRMRRYVGMVNDSIRPGGENTFQAILYDPQFYPTYTGDGEIVFQYHTVNNDPDVDPGEYDTPYATVGIVNLDATGGIEYTYWNRYPTAAAPLRPGRAIKFTTKLIVVVGYVRGQVVDAATGRPIPGAQIRGSRGSFATTNLRGEYLMENVLVGPDYSFTAWAPGYNDSTLTGFEVTEGETLQVDFALLHPELNLDVEEIIAELQPGVRNIRHHQIVNTGNGPLHWTTRIDYAEEGGNWRKILEIPVTQLTGDFRINGVDFFNGAIWVTGSNNNDNPNKFYRFNPQGEYLGALDQPGTSAYGLRGLSASDTLLYGGEGSWVLGVNREGQIVDSIPTPLNLVRALAYDLSTRTFWGANSRNEPLVHFNRQGEELASYRLELDIYGLGLYPDDSEGYTLYIFSRNKTNPALQVPEALVSRFNPTTGDFKVVTHVEGALEDRAGGMEISTHFDPHKWVMLAVLNNPQGHKVAVYDIGPNTRWLRVLPRTGELLPGESSPFLVILDAQDLHEGTYRLLLKLFHNAQGLQKTIPVTLLVDRLAYTEQNQSLPNTFALHSLYPNPLNSTLTIAFSLPQPGRVDLTLWDVKGREVYSETLNGVTAGKHQTILNLKSLPGGLYFLTLGWNHQKLTEKIVVAK